MSKQYRIEEAGSEPSLEEGWGDGEWGRAGILKINEVRDELVLRIERRKQRS